MLPSTWGPFRSEVLIPPNIDLWIYLNKRRKVCHTLCHYDDVLQTQYCRPNFGFVYEKWMNSCLQTFWAPDKSHLRQYKCYTGYAPDCDSSQTETISNKFSVSTTWTLHYLPAWDDGKIYAFGSFVSTFRLSNRKAIGDLACSNLNG